MCNMLNITFFIFFNKGDVLLTSPLRNKTYHLFLTTATFLKSPGHFASLPKCQLICFYTPYADVCALHGTCRKTATGLRADASNCTTALYISYHIVHLYSTF